MSVTTLNDAWEDVLKKLEDELNPRVFSVWLSPIKFKECSQSAVVLEVPNIFFKDWITENYLIKIQDEMSKIANTPIKISLDISSQQDPDPSADTVRDSQPVCAYELTENFVPASVELNPRYTFETFVIGSSNRFAHAACLAVSESPAKAYNPLFIHGGVGLGKTHLMQAIGHYVITRNRNARILYVPSEKFTNQLIRAIQKRSTTEFRQQYRNVDVLLIDDIQFIAGKESTQEEFFHTFNTLHDAHKQIVITSDRSPGDIAKLESRLISRFEWGLITDIQPPDYETRLAILRKKAEHDNVKVPDEILTFIAENIQSNIRQLEGALIRVVAYSSLVGVSFSIDTAKKILKDYLKEHKNLISIEKIQRKIAEEFKISFNDIKGKKRTKNIALPRQIAMYLCRDLTSFSLPEIGTAFDGKDHTTVLHAHNAVDKKIKSDTDFAKIILGIKKSLCE